MSSKYRESQKMKAVKLINGKNQLFSGDRGGGEYRKITRDFVLTDGENNIYEPIRNEVLQYFKENKISWWGGRKPTGHVLSSQIACLNHLYPLRKDKEAVLKIVKKISRDFVDVLPIETDADHKSYIQFEAVSSGDYLNEGKGNRGSNCTSIDALIHAVHNDGHKWLLPIEWKYTEHYGNENKGLTGCKANPNKCSGKTRRGRYDNLIANSKQLKNQNHEVYYHEPFYQLMRQTLWSEQMIRHKEIDADKYLHVHVVPRENKDLLDKKYKCSGLDMVSTWEQQLHDQTKYMVISPEDLLSDIDVIKYQHLRKYLWERYWH